MTGVKRAGAVLPDEAFVSALRAVVPLALGHVEDFAEDGEPQGRVLDPVVAAELLGGHQSSDAAW